MRHFVATLVPSIHLDFAHFCGRGDSMQLNRKCARALLTASILAVASSVQAQYSLSSLNSAVLEEFTGWGGTGNPTNWTVLAGNNVGSFKGQNNGASNTGGIWSYGATGSDERALGYLGSGNAAATTFAASTTFVNNTGAVITGLNIGYDAEQWRFAASRLNGFTVSFSIDGGEYTNLDSLLFVPSVTGTTGTPTITTLTQQVSDLSVAPGSSISLKFLSDRGPGAGSSQGVAIDNLSLTAVGSTGGNSSSISADANSVAFDRVIVGATPSQAVTLNKTGSDTTDYEITASSPATVSPSGTQSFGGGSQSQALQIGVDASTIGPKLGSVLVHNLSTTTGGAGQGSADADDTITVSADVVGHARPSLSTTAVETAKTVDFGIRAVGSTASQSLVVANVTDPAGAIAGLDVDAVGSSGDIAKASTNLTTLTNLAGGSSQTFAATLDTTSIGSFSSQYTMTVSDEDLQGAIGLGQLTLTIAGRVALGGDADLDNKVNTLDFNILAGNFSTGTQWQEGDFNRDGTVDSIDFGMLVDNFGRSVAPAPSLGSVVPEPASLSALVVGAGFMIRRRRK